MEATQSSNQTAFAIPKPCCTLAITGTEQAQLIQMFKAISNETRFEILKFLITHPGCITADLVDFLPIAQATVSQHLKVLRAAGWITICGRQGPATHYCLNNDRITWFKGQVGEIF
ncbi:MAG: winged helix-turn-helix transcriptional regulator [Anaerolineales bacterium]|nr:winged helix-turn-helix transcriptional regulator [Anaerolineales bacterium]